MSVRERERERNPKEELYVVVAFEKRFGAGGGEETQWMACCVQSLSACVCVQKLLACCTNFFRFSPGR